ncbi:ACT domain-containing protein [Corynebacterium sp. H128]|uniref:ACT domain-containing protein n=1 Tax=unclassified Corynebacterium TaxID=2624378 RepID=UPI0030A2AB14
MYAIISVAGPDHSGIIAAVATDLAAMDVNIHNVSQTIMEGYFTMILHVAFDESKLDIVTVQEHMTAVGKQQNLAIRVQSEALFNATTEI